MDTGHWHFDQEFDVTEWFGFVYRIIELDTNREYIGKKQFNLKRRKPVKGRKNRKIVISESNWKEYTGSSEELNARILLMGKDNYRFFIESLHKSKGGLSYGEIEAQVIHDVLRAKLPDGTKKFFNKSIGSIKFIPPEKHHSLVRQGPLKVDLLLEADKAT